MRTLTWTDSVRAVACLAVVVWHVVHTVAYVHPEVVPHAFVLVVGVAGREAVLVFIVLSGYLLGRHWRTEQSIGSQWRAYALRRAWRILPPYYAAIGLTVAAMLVWGLDRPSGTPWDLGLPLDAAHLAAALLLVTDFLGWVPLSHQLWSIPVEFHLYALGPLVVLLARRRSALVAGFVVSLACALLIAFPAPVFPVVFMGAFAAGVARRARSGFVPREWGATVALLGVLALTVPLVMTLAGTGNASVRNFAVADALVAPVLLWWLVRTDLRAERTALVRLLSRRPLVWVGHRSYSIYLTHALVLELMWRWGFDDLATPAGLLLYEVVALVLCLAVGAVFFRWVEHPAARRAGQVGRGRTMTDPARREHST